MSRGTVANIEALRLKKAAPTDEISGGRSSSATDQLPEVRSVSGSGAESAIQDDQSFLINICDIIVTDQPRNSFDQEDTLSHINVLAQDIRDHGQLNPILTSQHPEHANKYLLDDGECRLRAIRDVLGRDTIRATIISSTDALTRRVRQINANEKRQNYSRIEVARAIRLFIDDFVLSQKQAGEILGLSKGVVSKYLSLLTISIPQIAQDIHSGKLAATDYWNNKEAVINSYRQAQACDSVETVPVNKGGVDTDKQVSQERRKNISVDAGVLGELNNCLVRLSGQDLALIDDSTSKRDFKKILVRNLALLQGD